MTDDAIPERPERLVTQVPAESRLETLLAQYETVKADAEAAADRLKDLNKGIQAELLTMVPEKYRPTRSFEILAHHLGMYPALGVSYVEKWYLDTERMKEENPAAYATFAYQRGHWEIRRRRPRRQP